MKKSRLFITLFIVLSMLLFGCQKPEEPVPSQDPNACDIIDDCGDDENSTAGMTFKEAYESKNGKENSSGKPYRAVSIAEDHPFVKASAEDVVGMIENKETFYVYVGDEMCPWCRSVIEKTIEVAKEAGIDKIYYLEIWNDAHEEILRDQYVIEDGKTVRKADGTEAYHALLKVWDSVLGDYTLTDGDNKIDIGEKRIFAPNFFYVENGEVARFTTATSSLQEDARQELTEEILADEEAMLKEFFGIE